MKGSLLAFSLAIVAFTGAHQAVAQGVGGFADNRYFYNRGGFFVYADPGDVTVTINVWGNVRFPGLYEVRRGTDLAEVISYCGSSEETTLLSNRRQRRTVVRLSREMDGTRGVVYEREMRDLVNASDIPVVQEGDVVLIDVIETERVNWRDLLPVAGIVIGAANLLISIIALNQ